MVFRKQKELILLKKTLYSLMLSDDVVREADLLAHKRGTNRSNLINQILAEYLGMTTPQRRINDVFQAIEEAVAPYGQLVPFFTPNDLTMSLKSSLEYKYRPTVKYEVELYENGKESIGELSVIFRTQSAALISDMTDFFRLWHNIEQKYLPRYGVCDVSYALYYNKFCRSISVPRVNSSTKELAEVLSGYIELFDKLMKGFLSGRYSGQDVEHLYAEHIARQSIII